MIRRHLELILLVALFAAWQGQGSFLAEPAERLPDSGDSFLNAWILAQNHHALTTPGVSIWDAPNFFPTPNALAFSENLFGLLWLTLPVQHFTGNPILAVNAVVLLAFFLNAHATYLLCRTAGATHVPAIMGGLMLAFAPYHWSHLPHVQLLSLYPGIYAWNFALRFLQQARSSQLLWSAAFLIWTFYCSIYLGLIFGIAIALFALAYLLFVPPARAVLRQRKFWLAAALSVGLGGISLWPIAGPYLDAARSWDASRTIMESAHFSCELLSFLVPPALAEPNHAWLLHLLPAGVRRGEGAVFPGLIACAALIGAGLILAMRKGGWTNFPVLLKPLALTGVALAVLMLGPVWVWRSQETGFPLPYALLQQLPGLGAIRVPARFVMPLLVCVALAGSILLTALAARPRPAWRTYAGGVLVLFLLAADYRLRPDPGTNAAALLKPTELDAFLLQQPAKSALLYWPTDFASTRVAALQFQQAKHWRPLVDGTSGIFPATYVALHRSLKGPRDQTWSRDLHNSPAEIFLVDRETLPPNEDRANLRQCILAAGFDEQGVKGGFDVYRRVGPPPPAADGLMVRALQVVIGAKPGDDIAWAQMDPAGGTNWYAASGIVRRGRLGLDDAPSGRTRAIQLRVPAMLAPGQMGGSLLRADAAWRESSVVREIEIAGRSWGKGIPVRRILLADSSANADRRAQLHAELTLLAPESSRAVRSGQSLRVALEARNAGPTVWLSHDIASELVPRRGDIAAIVRWLPQSVVGPPTAPGETDAFATLSLEHPVHPGESATLEGIVSAPKTPGAYTLRVELVCQSVGWFSEVGPTRKIEMPIIVE